MKKFLLFLTILLWCIEAKAATLFLRDDATTWASAASWSNVSASDNTNSGPCTASDACIAELLSGNVSIDATAAAGSFSAVAGTGEWGGTLTHNAFIWTVSGSITFSAGMTYTPLATSTVTLAASNTLTTAGKLFPLMILNTGITTTLGDNLSFMASKVITLTLNGNSLAINGKTVSGNSATNRLLIRSDTLGTARTITNTTGTFANVDFRDITFSANIDYSGISGLAGDAGGNSGSTLTTGATQTYTGGTDNWSTLARWTSRVPLPQDDVVMSGVTGGTITADMPRLGKSINWTGASGTPTWTVSQTGGVTIYGSLTLISNMTFTGATVAMVFEGRSTFTLTSAGKSLTNGSSTINFNMVNGTMTLLSALTAGNAIGFGITGGGTTFDANGFNVTGLTLQSTGSVTRAVIMGSGTWTSTGTGSSTWSFTSTGMTLTSTGSTIYLSDTGASSKTFAGGGLTYNNLLIAGGGAGAIIITGANTFNRFYTDGGGTKSITLPGSTTTTILSGLGLDNGSNLITFISSAGSATVSHSGSNLAWSNVSLTNIIASATGVTYYAGAAPPSVDGGGNTNWTFANTPLGDGRSGSGRNRDLLGLAPRSRMIYA